MLEKSWDFVLLSGSDPHSGEYPAARWKQVEWLTGFTGEAGDVVISLDHAGLWTDTRYFIQANTQLDGTGVELHKMRVPEQVPIHQWLKEKSAELGHPITVALDGLCWSVDSVKEIEDAIKSGYPDSIVVSAPDLIDELWIDRPQIPSTPIQTLDSEITGSLERSEKINWLRKWMMQEEVDAVLISSLDEIAWLLNVRATDIEYNPYVISYLLLTDDSINWFVRKNNEEEDQDTKDSFNELSLDDVSITDYNSLTYTLENLPSGLSLFVDSSSLNYHIAALISDQDFSVKYGTSPIILKKAIKEDSEIQRLRECYIEDGLIMEKFLFWLDKTVANSPVTEWEASEKLTSLRSEILGYKGDSFANISAYGASAALPHYVTFRNQTVYLKPVGLYLIDSGGHYLIGTTDITRTVPLGPCTKLEIQDYTLVLKAMIGLSMAVFPKGTAGCQIDALARIALWKAHRNFGHGTGHGIGYYLGVHEGPQDIRQNFNKQALLPGMVVSNEPGLYRESYHGIRHENILLVKEDCVNEFGTWLSFETLTCCHIDTSIVDKDLLSEEEVDWINAYNASVFERLSSRMQGEELAWLNSKTTAL